MSRQSQAESHLYRGAELLRQKLPADAEREWLAARNLTPNDANVYRALGELYRAQGRTADARVAYNRLADVAPREPHVLCEFAEQELRSSTPENVAEATADALRAARLEPSCVRALTIAGDASMDQGDQKIGLSFLRRAVTLKPEDVPLALHLTNRLLEANDLAGALAVSRDLTRRYPGYSQGYALMATVCALYPRDTPESRSAAGLFLKALQCDPTNGLAHAKLGYLYVNTGDAARGIRHLEAARLLRYSQSSLLYTLARAYRSAGRDADSERVQREYQQIAKLEQQLTLLERQAQTAQGDAALQKRLRDTAAALDQARAGSTAAQPPPAPKVALPPGMNGGVSQ
jgi:predicted Zn-dependent protease